MKRQHGLTAAYLAALLSTLVFCGCGQKGPLFLPGDRSEMQTELPEPDRESLEDAAEDEDENTHRDTPDADVSEDENADPERLADPAAPPAGQGDD
jgi:predicted small lipoprotein YifL